MNGRARSNPVRLTLGVVLFVVVALAALIGLRPVTARGSAAAVASAARSMELASLRAWAPGPIEPVAVKASEVPARRADTLAPPTLGPALPVVDAIRIVLATRPSDTIVRPTPDHPASRVLARRHRSRAPPSC